MTIPTVAPHTTAIVTRLETTGLLVGDGRKPEGGGWQGAAGNSQFVTYGVLYTIGVLRDGPDASLSDRHTDPQLRYQVTSVGVDRLATETASDLFAQALLGSALVVPGRSTVLLIHETSVPAERDESVNPPVFSAVDRFRLDTCS